MIYQDENYHSIRLKVHEPQQKYQGKRFFSAESISRLQLTQGAVSREPRYLIGCVETGEPFHSKAGVVRLGTLVRSLCG